MLGENMLVPINTLNSGKVGSMRSVLNNSKKYENGFSGSRTSGFQRASANPISRITSGGNLTADVQENLDASR